MKSNLSSQLGYKRYSPFKHEPSLKINTPNGSITMDEVDVPLLAKGVNSGEVRVLPPNSGEHYFNDTEIIETPITNMNNMKPSNTKLWEKIFKNTKLKYGGVVERNELINAAHDEYIKQKGGYIISKDQYKILQGGGYTDSSTGEPLIVDDNLNDWLLQLKNSKQYEYLPSEIKDELKIFASNPDEINNLDKEFIQVAMPNTFQLFNMKSKNPVNIVSSDPSMLEEAQEIQNKEMKGISPSSPVSEIKPLINTSPVMQKGGYVKESPADVINSFTKARILANSTPAPIAPNTKIKYKLGGQIKEGIVKSYNPATNKYILY